MVSRSTGPLRTILPAVAVGLAALLVGCSAGQVTQTDSIEPAVNGNRGDVGDIALRDVMIAYPDSGEYREGDQAALVLTIVNTGDSDDELVAVSSPVTGDEVPLIGDTDLPANSRLQVVVPEEPVATASSEPSVTSEPSEPPSEPSEPTTTDTSVPEESITEPSAPADTGGPGAPDSGSATPPSEPEDSEATETPSSESVPEEVGVMSIVLVGLTQDLPMGRNVPVTFVFANAGQITINLPIASPATARQDPPATEEEGGH